MDAADNRLAIPRESDYWLLPLGIHAICDTSTDNLTLASFSAVKCIFALG